MRLNRFSVKTAIAVVLGIFCCGSLLLWQLRVSAHELFGNMTYLSSSPYIVEKVTLVDGKRVTKNGRLYHYVSYLSQYVYGDFNQDGLRDAAVIITQGEGGSGSFRELAFLINDGEEFVHQFSRGLGDRVRINSLSERAGTVVVDMFVRQEGDCMAWPTRRVKNVYDYLELYQA